MTDKTKEQFIQEIKLLQERIAQLEAADTERKKAEVEKQKRLTELEIFYKASVGREERIIELKKEIEALKGELNEKK